MSYIVLTQYEVYLGPKLWIEALKVPKNWRFQVVKIPRRFDKLSLLGFYSLCIALRWPPDCCKLQRIEWMGCSYLIGNRIRVNDKRMLNSKNLVSKIFNYRVCCAYCFSTLFFQLLFWNMIRVPLLLLKKVPVVLLW